MIDTSFDMRSDAGGQIALQLLRESTDTAQATELSSAVEADRTQLDELAQMYADQQITAPEWRKARTVIDQRLNDNLRRLRTLSNNDALNALSAVGGDLASQWQTLDISRQHAIVKAVVDHIVIHSLRSGPTFNPARVEPIWRI